MTAVVPAPAHVMSEPGSRTEPQREASGGWLGRHRCSLAIGLVLLALCGTVHAINLNGWPGRVGDDEGTYAAQAYAMIQWGRIAHYTYWYDHPFGGWLQMAAIFRATNVLHWTTTAVEAARETMVIFHVVSCGLVYLVARRLGLRRTFAVVAVLAFSLSPLALQYQRMAFLDNISTMWVLAAAVFALSPRRSLASVTAVGAALAFAFWSKETSVLLAPGIFWMAWQNRDPRNWRYLRTVGLFVFLAVVSIWPLYALIKNELFPGQGHVSLTTAVQFQLFSRPSSGSLLTAGSGTRTLAETWLRQDPYLLVTGVVAAVLALGVRPFRPVSFLLLFQLVMMCRDGYMPYAYVTAMLPFAALSIAAVADTLSRDPIRRTGVGGVRSAAMAAATFIAPAVLGAGAVLAGVVLIFSWLPGIATAVTAQEDLASFHGEQWIMKNVPHDATIIVDDVVWTDLVRAGFTHVNWLYKVDLDPAVKATLPNGWRSVDYVAVGVLDKDTLANSPTLASAMEQGTVVASFDDFKIYQVDTRH